MGHRAALSVRAMLEARSVAVVGASARVGSFGQRLVTELQRSPSRPELHLVNPRYSSIGGLPCLPSLAEVPPGVDLVALAVPDAALEQQLAAAAARGDRSAVIFGSAYEPPLPGRPDLRTRLAAVARGAGMALCGGGGMGFVNVARGLRAIGYLERDPIDAGPVALVSHSGSAFSALLRTRREIGYTLAVSAGQELVTSTADYIEYALDLPQTRVVALVLETVRAPLSLRSALTRAAAADVPVVLLAVGRSAVARELVTAHSGALAGDDAAWEALAEGHGLLRVEGLDELTDTVELLAAGRRVRSPAGRPAGLATVHDSGAERALVADVAAAVGVSFARLSPATLTRLDEALDDGLEAGNPLDVWGTGANTRELFASCLETMLADPSVAAAALCVDLVEEYDGDDSYPLAALDAYAATDKPVAVLSNLSSAIDQEWAAKLRAGGVPVLEGTRSGLRALGHLLALGRQSADRNEAAPVVDEARRAAWRGRLAAGPLTAAEGFELLAAYGIGAVAVEEAADRASAVAAAERLGWPVVLKTAEPAVNHKSDVGGVHLGLPDGDAVAQAYDGLAARLGPRVLVATEAEPGVELVAGLVRDPLFGPLVLVGAGGILVELLRDRRLALPPLDRQRAGSLVERLHCRPLLDGFRGAPPVDIGSLVTTLVGVGQLAIELGDDIEALDINPLIASPHGTSAVDVLVIAREPSHL